MTSRRRPPTRIPATPWSHPGMTCPAPNRKSSGSPRSRRCVELLAGGEGDTDVVHAHRVAGRRLRALADGLVGDDQVSGRVALGRVDLGPLSGGHGSPLAE